MCSISLLQGFNTEAVVTGFCKSHCWMLRNSIDIICDEEESMLIGRRRKLPLILRNAYIIILLRQHMTSEQLKSQKQDYL